ncbi:MAG: hypothetical protein NTW08_09905 [Gammaproteobacteria bacterium]|nr:hypothetical protein [Gammaproteobacteria bacterium]
MTYLAIKQSDGADNEKPMLEDLLSGSPQEKMKVTVEDRQWLDDMPVGNEVH